MSLRVTTFAPACVAVVLAFTTVIGCGDGQLVAVSFTPPEGCGDQDPDHDGLAGDCDPCPDDPTNDIDGDDVCGESDNCPRVPNADQVDGDDDGNGDACDCPIGPDQDGDGLCDAVDPCPLGEPCHVCSAAGGADSDEDGVCDVDDTCPDAFDADQADEDGDHVGDECDKCPGDSDNDADGDGLCTDIPLCAQADDTDADVDGVPDGCDACLADDWNDLDGDGHCGLVDDCPYDADIDQVDSDGDGLGDACDPCPNPGDDAADADDDGVCDAADVCPQVADPEQWDLDGDGVGVACDFEEQFPAGWTQPHILSALYDTVVVAESSAAPKLAIVHQAHVMLDDDPRATSTPAIEADGNTWMFRAGGGLEGGVFRETPQATGRIDGRFGARPRQAPVGAFVETQFTGAGGTYYSLDFWSGMARTTLFTGQRGALYDLDASSVLMLTTVRATDTLSLFRPGTSLTPEPLDEAFGHILLQSFGTLGNTTRWFCAYDEAGQSRVFEVDGGGVVASSRLDLPNALTCHVSSTTDEFGHTWVAAAAGGGRFSVYLMTPGGPVLVTDQALTPRLAAARSAQPGSPGVIGINTMAFGGLFTMELYRVEGDHGVRLTPPGGEAVGAFAVAADGTVAWFMGDRSQASGIAIAKPSAAVERILVPGVTPGAPAWIGIAPDGVVWLGTATRVVAAASGVDPVVFNDRVSGYTPQTLASLGFWISSSGKINSVSGQSYAPIDAAPTDLIQTWDPVSGRVTFLRYAAGVGPVELGRWTASTGDLEVLTPAVELSTGLGPNAFLLRKESGGPFYRASLSSDGTLTMSDEGYTRRPDFTALSLAGLVQLDTLSDPPERVLCPADPKAPCRTLIAPVTQWTDQKRIGSGDYALIGRDAAGTFTLVRSKAAPLP